MNYATVMHGRLFFFFNIHYTYDTNNFVPQRKSKQRRPGKNAHFTTRGIQAQPPSHRAEAPGKGEGSPAMEQRCGVSPWPLLLIEKKRKSLLRAERLHSLETSVANKRQKRVSYLHQFFSLTPPIVIFTLEFTGHRNDYKGDFEQMKP